MKEIKCLDCEETFKAESSDDAMQQMMPHYKSEHAEMMEKGTEEDRKVWFEKFNKDWEEAKEVEEDK